MILLLPACLSELIDMMLIPYAQTSKATMNSFLH